MRYAIYACMNTYLCPYFESPLLSYKLFFDVWGTYDFAAIVQRVYFV